MTQERKRAMFGFGFPTKPSPVVLLAGVPDPITGKKMHSTLWYLQHSPA
eukprot:CAMPEP_0173058226 /NCGR_PEP_ID=MMETSP1102-20130122/1228_1 /TAXON_ID=49646 /ORGANISM="Geminigera sp., Strain Caron Lab Isolate" /LENGTH=48 /DNA_ID= /DNA_START= /DNA_END= /DNA_ORIENTATION=